MSKIVARLVCHVRVLGDIMMSLVFPQFHFLFKVAMTGLCRRRFPILLTKKQRC